MIQASPAFAAAFVLAAASSAATAAPAPPPVAKITLPQLRSQLGETLQAWKSAPRPAGIADYAPVCRAETWAPAAATISGPQPVTACTYEKTFGKLAIRPSIRLEPGDHRVRELDYLFRDGRLAAVTADTSRNAYISTLETLTKTLGPAAQTQRRQVSTRDGAMPQVVAAWRGPKGAAAIVDPAPPHWDMRIVVAEGALAPSRSAASQAKASPRG